MTDIMKKNFVCRKGSLWFPRMIHSVDIMTRYAREKTRRMDPWIRWPIQSFVRLYIDFKKKTNRLVRRNSSWNNFVFSKYREQTFIYLLLCSLHSYVCEWCECVFECFPAKYIPKVKTYLVLRLSLTSKMIWLCVKWKVAGVFNRKPTKK